MEELKTIEKIAEHLGKQLAIRDNKIKQLEKQLEIAVGALEKLQNKHLSGHTMDFRPCDTCDTISTTMEEIRRSGQ